MGFKTRWPPRQQTREEGTLLPMTGTIRQFFNDQPSKFDPREYLKPARANIKELVRHKLINVLGCAGKA